jgi:hypothetical protein
MLLLLLMMMMKVGFVSFACNSLVFKTANFVQELMYHVV